MADNILGFKDVSQKDVFTRKGSYCGKIKDVEIDLGKFSVRAVIVGAKEGSYLSQKVGGSRDVVVPYHMVRSIDDIVVINDFETEDIGEE
jgi:sporulation protein YlmC with PRC-barrel domain